MDEVMEINRKAYAFLVLCLALYIAFVLSTIFAPAVSVVCSESGWRVISYFNGEDSLEMVIDDSSGGAWLRMAGQDAADHRFTNIMAREVKRLITNRSTILGESGYEFVYEGGHPIWGPYTAMSPPPCPDYQCLFFSYKAEISGKRIIARGEEQMGYDGYTNIK